MGEHVADPTEAIPGERGNYMLYVRASRRALRRAAVASGFFGLSLLIRIVQAFHESSAQGWTSVVGVAWVLAGCVLLVALVVLVTWAPAVIRTAKLRQMSPGATAYLLRGVSNFWNRLPLVDPTNDAGSRMNNATITIGESRAVIWRGVLHPRVAAELPLHQLVRIETDRPGDVPFERRIAILTFQLGLVTEELPIALRRVGGFGFVRLSPRAEREIVGRLWAAAGKLSPAAPENN